MPYLSYLNEEEAKYTLREIHGACDNHIEVRAIACKLL